jgi:hypothetical protein
MRKQLLLGITLAVIASLSGSLSGSRSQSARADESAQLSALMSYFGTTCPSQGQLTQAAISQVQALTDVVTSIQKDPDCQTLSGAMGQLGILSQQVQILSQQTTQTQILSLQRQQQELLLQLSTVSGASSTGTNASTAINNATLQAAIESSLQSTEVNLAGLEGTQQAQNSVQAVTQAQALTTLVSSTGTFLNQSLANQACLLNHPSVLTGIASLAGSVAAAATTSGVSLGLAAGTQILDSMVDYIKNKKLANKVHKLAQAAEKDAYACVLESLSDQWCSAQDASNLIKIEGQALTPGNSNPSDPIWQGVELLDFEVPKFLGWLSEVEAGTTPTNDAESLRQKRTFNRDESVKSSTAFASGFIAENQIVFNQAANAQAQWTIEKAVINQFLAELSIEQSIATAIQTTNPLVDIYGLDFAPYFLLGLTQSQAPITGPDYCPLTTFNPFSPPTTANPCGWPVGAPPFVPSLAAVQTNMNAWVAQARTKVNNELITVLQSDPLQVINDAMNPDLQGRSVVASIGSFVKFLTDVGTKFPTAKTISDDTIKKLLDIKNYIVAGSLGNDAAAASVTSIYSEAGLSYGTSMFQNRLESALRLTLNAVIANGTGVDNQADILLLTASDLMAELQTFSGTSDLTLQQQDAERARTTTADALQNFSEVFADNINDMLKGYAAKPNDADAYDMRAQTCLLLLAVPEWPKGISQQYCLGVQMKSTFEKGPPSVAITPSLIKSDQKDRACVYVQFLRNSKIYQQYLNNTKTRTVPKPS